MNKIFLSLATIICATMIYSHPVLASKHPTDWNIEDESPKTKVRCLTQDTLLQQMIQLQQQLNDYEQERKATATIIMSFNLSTLSLNNEGLICFPESFCLLSLTSVDLSENDLTYFPHSFYSLTNLTNLNLSFNCLQVLSPDFGNLIALTTLDLPDNAFSTFPQVVCTLTNLTSLAFGYQEESSNTFTSIPEDLGNLQKLMYLNLNFNHLTSLPHSIGQLKNLEELRLCDNRLSKLPCSFERLTNLTVLNLHYNEFESVPSCLVRLPKLQSLYIGYMDEITMLYGYSDLEFEGTDCIQAFLQYDRALKRNKYVTSLPYGLFMFKELDMPKDLIYFICSLMHLSNKQEIGDEYLDDSLFTEKIMTDNYHIAFPNA